MEIKKILFPTDFTEGSQAALCMAADLVRKYCSKLYVIHVLYDIASASGWYVPHTSMEEVYKDMEKTAQKQLETIMLEELRGYKDMEFAVLRGQPAHEILRYATEKDVNLIVMGTHGRKGLDKVIFGSVAGRVVRQSKYPVLTVRAPE
ncbi:MAG: universal stress protein [Actinomycetota bacterium]|nr:universal stress protein [Actinomycetota bacterium]